MGLRLKIMPQWDAQIPRPDEVSAFRDAVLAIEQLGYGRKLLHYSNGTVLLEKWTDEELKLAKGSHA